MKLHNIIISILIVSVITLGCIDYVTDLGDNYGTTADFSGLSDTSQRLNETQQTTTKLAEDISNLELSLNPIDLFMLPYEMIRISWNIGKTIFSSWETVQAMITDIGKGIGESGIPLPPYLIPTIISIFIITIVAIVIYALFKWKFET